MLTTVHVVRRSTPGLLLGTAVLTSAWAFRTFAWPVLRLAKVEQHTGHAGLLYLHSVGGTILLGVGAAALFVGWTRRGFRWHRVIGYTYLLGGGLGATLGIVLALARTHTEPELPLTFVLSDVSGFGVALATQGFVCWSYPEWLFARCGTVGSMCTGSG